MPWVRTRPGWRARAARRSNSLASGRPRRRAPSPRPREPRRGRRRRSDDERQNRDARLTSPRTGTGAAVRATTRPTPTAVPGRAMDGRRVVRATPIFTHSSRLRGDLCALFTLCDGPMGTCSRWPSASSSDGRWPNGGRPPATPEVDRTGDLLLGPHLLDRLCHGGEPLRHRRGRLEPRRLGAAAADPPRGGRARRRHPVRRGAGAAVRPVAPAQHLAALYVT